MMAHTVRVYLCLYLLLHAWSAAGARSSDRRLLGLVPPESQIVAGTQSPPPTGQLSTFLLITRNNGMDHKDFFALTGGDATRRILEVVFTAAEGPHGTLNEHSLLVRGHFDRYSVFRQANGGRATITNYRGLAVLVVPPFSRERDTFTEERWLAIPDSGTALFGSINTVKQELDRWLLNAPADPLLLERLARLGGEPDSWCLLPAPLPGGVIETVFRKLDPALGAVAGEGRPLEYGIHFGRRVEVTATLERASQPAWSASADSVTPASMPVSYLLPGPETGADGPGRTVVKMAPRRYRAWLDEFSRSELTLGSLLR